MCYGCSNCGACGKKVAEAPSAVLVCANCETPIEPGVSACPVCGSMKMKVGEVKKVSKLND